MTPRPPSGARALGLGAARLAREQLAAVGGELEHAYVEIGDLAPHLNVDALHRAIRESARDDTEALGERHQRTNRLGKHSALHVDGVRHEFSSERESHGLGH